MTSRKNPPRTTPAEVPPPGKNRLAFEKSPYLLQHAHNPVDWYPWGEAAFEKARRENKPVFLSVGYSTCHWCHVMERESFEDSEVAALMNDAFVNVKVDREERPDVDAVYMSACQLMRGNGGWPLTVIMTPDGKPFFVATYLPKSGRQGLPGMMDLVPQIREAWSERRQEVDNVSTEVADRLKRVFERSETDFAAGLDALDGAYRRLAAGFDPARGGFGRAPKFPAPHNLLFLLRYWRRTRELHALEMVERTLEHMSRGGICDHVGFGFHRYSTDERWFAPHFEKMIYDQALLVIAYAECHQATGKAAYRRAAEEILAYVARDMTDPAGGFYSAEDADSEGVEGKFYLWSEREIIDVLGESEGRFAADLFGVEPTGNFSEDVAGANILHLRRPIEKTAEELGQSEEAVRERMERIRRVLFETREKRKRPHKDDKVLADWNGLMIAAFAGAARIFEDARYAEAAGNAARFILNRMKSPDGGLYHRYRDGEAAVPGNLDDYAFLAWGLIELYEATLDPAHLERAIELTDAMDLRLWDSKGGGYFLSPENGDRLIVRAKEIYDGAIPSGNSVAALNLVRLGRITGDARYEEKAERIGRVFAREIEQAPSAYTFYLTALEIVLGRSREIVIVGDPSASGTRAMIRAVRGVYAPEVTLLFKSTREADPRIDGVAPFTAEYKAVGGAPTAYVCEDRSCSAPMTDVAELVEALRAR